MGVLVCAEGKITVYTFIWLRAGVYGCFLYVSMVWQHVGLSL